MLKKHSLECYFKCSVKVRVEIAMLRSFVILFLINISALSAAEFPPSAAIFLVDAQDNETRIGEVVFTDVATGEAGATAVRVDMDNAVFTEHFLAMRPFRCIEGSTEWFCYLQYPYDLHSVITVEDLSDLEYQLLFLRKAPTEFGIDAWNGLYYKLAVEVDGSIVGKLLEGDLNSLQSPPSEQYAKPVDLEEFIPASKSKRLFPKLRIYQE